MDVKTFRDNLFQMNTRRFGKVMEMVVKNLTNTKFSDNIHHDLNTGTNNGTDIATRVEVKFSRVEKTHNRTIEDFNVLSVIESEGLSVRLFPFGEWQYNDFDCNIQQIKRDQFDVLFYGMLFADRVVVFMATPDQIGDNMKYSNKQHKGNEGEGQFHIKPKTLQYHLDNHHFVTLSYADLIKVLTR
ncbi:hypothetical protein QFZ31_006689 [Neobacillus niacini]|uniref:hypothetical protein n=1 Tax=Neobacillus driksii TaxID=3035913 RepID=UPI00278370BB|nr:hypothetical protein [Neobacillus niacini]MDQ0976637.1 hypothetical protein [Neobacillus niacini]